VGYKLKKKIAPTLPELMFLARRRAGLTQRQYAKEIGMAQWKISRMETGVTAIPPELLNTLETTIKPTDSELLTLARRRNGEFQHEAAVKLGIERPYLVDVERKGRGGRAEQHLEKYLKS
jgi:DNA-binding XRE family transcriptional regulator